MKLERYAQLTQFLAGMACENLVEVGTWNGRHARNLRGPRYGVITQ
jgi:hypothetical protein